MFILPPLWLIYALFGFNPFWGQVQPTQRSVVERPRVIQVTTTRYSNLPVYR